MLFPLPLPLHCHFWLTPGNPPFSGSGTIFWTSPSASGFPTHDTYCVLTLHPSLALLSQCLSHYVMLASVTVSTKLRGTTGAGIMFVMHPSLE